MMTSPDRGSFSGGQPGTGEAIPEQIADGPDVPSILSASLVDPRL
jgi:hypothetical protein